MLTELSIKDFAIIEDLTITFHDGLTVLTGETGAGKSIIIDAVGLLSGGRGSVEFVRHGTKKAILEGLFTVDDLDHPVHQVGKEFGIDITKDGMVVLNRTITSSGKSICRVNGKLVTLGILKEFGKTLIDIHSQHETQSLMDVDRHIELLDLYNRDQIVPIKQEYLQLYKQMMALKKRFSELRDNEQEMAQRLDLYEFQLRELQEANLSPNEDEQLAEERERLANYEKIYQGIHDAYHALYGEQKGLDWVGLALNGLEKAAEYEPELSKSKEELTNHYFLLEELTYELRNHLEQLEFDPERLNGMESRINELNRLKRKYGQTVNDMLEYAAKIEDEIDQIKNKDSHLQTMETQLLELAEDALLEAKHLHDVRIEAANLLVDDIHQELKDLYLEKASFDVDITERKGSDTELTYEGIPIQLGENGFDIVKFLITTNPGEPLKPIHKVASGGELSRIMLALKRIFAKHQRVTSIIFDEVDTGVSGRVAQAIAEKIYGISLGSQVLCITHLPQLASMADSHLLIEKKIKNERTSTMVTELSKEESAEEISRMITGAEITETSKQHASELISMAKEFKKNVLV
ncbi:DNA repair protein RecN [Aquibacillus sediminis]|uniref:DNA repair protein RecN n=1 Tax=Aquibacillus sediminis TaxID=2574734 RepID=UPI0011098230|nr:DNA repair protein RecN [Aquibacillus sediminis]